jgi:hypothetical protein
MIEFRWSLMNKTFLHLGLYLLVYTLCHAASQTDIENIVRKEAKQLNITISSFVKTANGYSLKAVILQETNIPQFLKALDSSDAFENIRLMMIRKVSGGNEFDLELLPKIAEAKEPQPATTDANGKGKVDLVEIAEKSFTTYPWRIEMSRTSKKTHTTYSSSLEAQSETRLHATMDAPMEEGLLKIEVIVIDTDSFLKVLSAPPAMIKELGLPLEEWKKLGPNHPGKEFADEIIKTSKTAGMMDSLGFSKTDLETAEYRLVDEDKLNGQQMHIYEMKTSGEKPQMYRQWIGVEDHRIYRIQEDGGSSTLLVNIKYDPSLTIKEPPAR